MIIVVARYKEDVEWTKQFSNVLIYNKGEPLGEGYNEIMLENVGREGHTYFKHICDHYDNLDDYTCFLQGNPFDHSPNIIKDLQNYIEQYSKDKDLKIGFKYLSLWMLRTNLHGCDYHPTLPMADVYEKIFHERKESMEIQFGMGAQCIVSRETILKKPKSFYENILKLVDYDINPLEVYVLERLQRLIFGGPNKTPEGTSL
jgi:hypothetical protein